jgi:hypothetical protein
MLAVLKTVAATAIAALTMLGGLSLAMPDTRIALRRIFYARTGTTFKSIDDANAACGGQSYVVGIKQGHVCLDELGRRNLEGRIEEALKKVHSPKN